MGLMTIETGEIAAWRKSYRDAVAERRAAEANVSRLQTTIEEAITQLQSGATADEVVDLLKAGVATTEGR